MTKKRWVSSVRLVIEKLTDEQRIQIIKDNEQFEQDGFIGDCVLRATAHSIGEFASDHITMWMHQVAFETYRWYAEVYLKEKGLHEPSATTTDA